MAILKRKQSAQEQAIAIRNIVKMLVNRPDGIDEVELEATLTAKGFTRPQIAQVVTELISGNEIEREAPK